MKDLFWWKELFISDRNAWKEALLTAPEGQSDWDLAVRSWPSAEVLDQAILPAATEGPLAGVPVAVKDLFDRRGRVTLAGSTLLQEIGTPAEKDAAILQDFGRLGAVPVGSTNMNEFAYGLDGFNPHTGNCPHPSAEDRISGGSSSGSAWIVGRGLLPAALGTDTGGSIRVPAALCGIYGFRGDPDPAAQEGVFPLAPSFDTVGWFTASPTDMLELLNLLWSPRMTGSDPLRLGWYTPTSVPLTESVRRGHQAFFAEHRGIENARDLAQTLDTVLDDAFWAYNVIGSSEAYEVHKEWFRDYKDRYNPEVWKLIDRSRHWEQGSLDQAWALQKAISELLDVTLRQYAAILMPASHTEAPRMEEVDQPFRINIIRLTSLASLAGLPVLTIPVPTEFGLSTGIQVITRRERVLSVAHHLLTGSNE